MLQDESFAALLGDIVERTVVYGPRAEIAHLYLKALLYEAARARFWALHARHDKKMLANGGLGGHIWMGANKTPKRRWMNLLEIGLEEVTRALKN